MNAPVRIPTQSPQGVVIAGRPAHGTPEWNAIYDAGRKVLGYPSREELAEFNRRFPIYGSPEWVARKAAIAKANPNNGIGEGE